MIQDDFTYFSVLLAIGGFLKIIEVKTQWKFFKYIPIVVIIYVFYNGTGKS